jgi:hypothetical protein
MLDDERKRLAEDAGHPLQKSANERYLIENLAASARVRGRGLSGILSCWRPRPQSSRAATGSRPSLS